MGTEKRGAGATYQRQLNEICGQIKRIKWVPPAFIYLFLIKSPDMLPRLLRMSLARQNALRARLSIRLPRP